MNYPEWRDWHESVIAQYPLAIRTELRIARAKFWKVSEDAKSFEPGSGAGA